MKLIDYLEDVKPIISGLFEKPDDGENYKINTELNIENIKKLIPSIEKALKKETNLYFRDKTNIEVSIGEKISVAIFYDFSIVIDVWILVNNEKYRLRIVFEIKSGKYQIRISTHDWNHVVTVETNFGDEI